MKVFECFPKIRRVQDAEVGIEIEMEGRNLGLKDFGEGMIVADNWKLTSDGSLRGESCEYVLAGPITRKQVGKSLRELNKFFRARNAILQPSNRCGVHVHVNVQDLEVKQVINMMLLYFVFEDVLVRYCGEEREGNLFCLRAKDASQLLYVLHKAHVDQNLNYFQEDAYRYAAMNASSLKKYGTLEFRALPTSQDIMSIEKWVHILLALKDFALTIDNPKSIVEQCSFAGERYIDQVFGGHAQALDTPDTAASVWEGVRRIQHIAYAEVKKVKKPGEFDAFELELIAQARKLLALGGKKHGFTYVGQYYIYIPSEQAAIQGEHAAITDTEKGREDDNGEEDIARGRGARPVVRARPPIPDDDDGEGMEVGA